MQAAFREDKHRGKKGDIFFYLVHGESVTIQAWQRWKVKISHVIAREVFLSFCAGHIVLCFSIMDVRPRDKFH